MGTSPKFGHNLSFKITIVGCTSLSSGDIVDISPHVMSVDGLPGEREYSDITCGSTVAAPAHQWLAGLVKADFSLNCLLDQTTSGNYASAWKTLCNYSTDAYSRYFAYAPASTAAGYPQVTGRAWVKGLSLPAKPLEPLTFSVSCSVDSTVMVSVCG